MEKHKIKIQQINGRANKIFIDELELKGVYGYEIQNSEDVNGSKMKLTIEFNEIQLLEIISE